MSSSERKWRLYGGLEQMIRTQEDRRHTPRSFRLESSGHRNGHPGIGPRFVPYVWNIGEKMRRAQVDKQLREVRERLGFEQVTGWYDQSDCEAETGGEA